MNSKIFFLGAIHVAAYILQVANKKSLFLMMQ